MPRLHWRRQREIERLWLPDLPEVRAYWRVCYWDGFLGGALRRKVWRAKQRALHAVAMHETGMDES